MLKLTDESGETKEIESTKSRETALAAAQEWCECGAWGDGVHIIPIHIECDELDIDEWITCRVTQ